MKLMSNKSVFRQYYLRCLIILLLYISVVVLCIYAHPNIWSVVFCTVLYLPVKIFIRISANQTIASVLFNDLNALQFQQIIKSNKYFFPPLSYRINAAIFAGDYQTIVNIVSWQMQKKRCKVKEKYFYLSLTACMYFELRDFEKLKLILKKYDEIKELYPSKNFIKFPYSTWSYYRYFLDGNYEACKTICKERLEGLNYKSWDAKIRKLQSDFAYAVACYENGDIDEAKECFESIIFYAPNMHSAEISKKYVDAIEMNSKITLFSEVVPEKNYQLYDNRTIKKTHRYRVITLILSIIVCSLIIASSVLDFVEKKEQNQQNSNYNSELAEFEKKLNSAISNNYDNAKFIKYFSVINEDQHIDTFCLVDIGGRLDLTSIVTYDDGKSFDLILLVDDIQLSYDYSVKSIVSDYQIAFYISDKQLAASGYKEIIEFSLNNKNHWFGVKNITLLT